MASLRRILTTFTASLDLGLPRIEGRVLVVGSAPGGQPPEGGAGGWTVMTINASQVIAENWGVARPDYTIIRPEIGGDMVQDRKAREVLSGKSAGTVIVTGPVGGAGGFRSLLASFDYGYERLVLISRPQRQRLLFQVARATGPLEVGKLSVSSGIFGAALCLFLGAPEVAMAGFSFTTHGHAYDRTVTQRVHIDEDAAVLRGLAARTGRLHAADAKFAAEAGLPLWRPEGR